MIRVWHPYHRWEEYHAGMWRRVYGQERQRFLQEAIVFTGDAQLYGHWMLKVIDAWPISCEHNLTDIGMNRRAWTGHAACCLAINCPEDITRHAWGHLTDDQQRAANRQAEMAVYAWEQRYAAQNPRVRRDVATAWLSRRDSRRSGFGLGGTEQSALL